MNIYNRLQNAYNQLVGVSFEPCVPEKGDTCVVCFEEATANEESAWKGDGAHNFHVTCIDQWLTQEGVDAKCPTCKLPAVSLTRRAWSMVEADAKRIGVGAILGLAALIPIPHTGDLSRLAVTSLAALGISCYRGGPRIYLETATVSFVWAMLQGGELTTALSIGVLASQITNAAIKNKLSGVVPGLLWADIFVLCHRGKPIPYFGTPASALPVVSYGLVEAYERGVFNQIFRRATEAIFS